MQKMPVFIIMLLMFTSLSVIPAKAKCMTVAVTIVPQKYFVDQIAKNRVRVIVMVPPGANPHSYEPKPKQMIELSNAKIYLTIGVEFEKAWLAKILDQNKHIRVFHMEEGIEKIPIPSTLGIHMDDATPSNHWSGSKKKDNKLDPHIWLSPLLAQRIAKNTAKALSAVDPENARFYFQNLDRFLTLIKNIDEKIRNILNKKRHTAFLVFHPAWGYFAKSYGLVQIPIELEGKEPSPRQLKELMMFSRKKGIKAILVEPQFSERIASIIAKEIDGKLIKVDPLSYDWGNNLLRVAKIIGAISK